MIFWERQKSLTAFYEACTKPVRDAYDLTQMQFNILMFLHNNPQFDTAGDLVKTRCRCGSSGRKRRRSRA